MEKWSFRDIHRQNWVLKDSGEKERGKRSEQERGQIWRKRKRSTGFIWLKRIDKGGTSNLILIRSIGLLSLASKFKTIFGLFCTYFVNKLEQCGTQTALH